MEECFRTMKSANDPFCTSYYYKFTVSIQRDDSNLFLSHFDCMPWMSWI